MKNENQLLRHRFSCHVKTIVMSSIEQIFLLLSKMGCICTKQSIRIEGINYANIEKIGEGWEYFSSNPDSGTDFLKLFFRGFSSISLIEDKRSRKRYALKKITCHSTEDQIQAKKEIDFHKKFDHPNILNLIGSEIKGQADIVHDVTSDAYLVLPYFPVSFVIASALDCQLSRARK